jgi:hypothetical protein
MTTPLMASHSRLPKLAKNRLIAKTDFQVDEEEEEDNNGEYISENEREK